MHIKNIETGIFMPTPKTEDRQFKDAMKEATLLIERATTKATIEKVQQENSMLLMELAMLKGGK